ncbi:2254_t:CDS:2, partial [Diversispora eburnea]
MSVSSNTRAKKSKDNLVLKPNVIGEVKFNPTMKKAKPDKKSNNKRNNIPMEEANAEASGSKINPQIVILTNEKIIEDNDNTNTEVMEEIESRNYELQEDIVNGEENNDQGEKVEKVRKILKKEMAVVLVKTEIFKDNRMISILYDNEEEMVKGKQCDVGGNAGKPTYIHRAKIFRRNPVKELMHGVKLWDVPLGMKNKELKKDLENKYGEIERLTMRVNNMWQSAVTIFKEKEDTKKVMEKWSIIIGEDSLRIIQIDQTADNLKSRGEHATRIIGLPNGITARKLWPHVEKIEARTCYIPRTRTYRQKNEAIISFEDHETYIVGIAETNCTENKEKWFIEGGNKYRGHWSSDGMGAGVAILVAKELNKYICKAQKFKGRIIIIVMGDFNAIPSSSIDRNNNNQSNILESEIFSILTGKDLIDSYRTIHPDSSGFTWKKCFTEQLELVTESDHKIIQLKIKKTWQIHLDREVQDNIGPKYNIKLMCDEKWMKFTTHVEKKLKTTTISSRKEKYGITVNSLNKNWKTLKNIMIEAADC